MLSVSEYITTNVITKPVTFLLGTNHGGRSFTCVAVILSLLQENNISNSIPHRTSLTLFTVSRNLKIAKHYFNEAKTYKPSYSMIPH